MYDTLLRYQTAEIFEKRVLGRTARDDRTDSFVRGGFRGVCDTGCNDLDGHEHGKARQTIGRVERSRLSTCEGRCVAQTKSSRSILKLGKLAVFVVDSTPRGH